MGFDGRTATGTGGGISWLLLLAFNAVGLYVAGMALDLIPNDPSQWHVPRWIGVVAGLVFVLAGWLPVAGRARDSSRGTRMLLAALVVALGAVGNWMLLHPQAPSSPDTSPAGRFTGAFVTIRSHLPEEYARPLMLLGWDVPMGLFALWLLVGGRKRTAED